MCNENNHTITKAELLARIDSCTTISEIFEFVRAENIDMRMQTLCSASCIPPRMLTYDNTSDETPLQRLKAVVRLTVENTR